MRIEVNAEAPYAVLFAPGVSGTLGDQIGAARRVGIVCSEPLREVATRIAAQVRAAGAVPSLIQVPTGEAAKTPGVLTQCWRTLATDGFTRSDLVVGVGGGATTDLAGFLAGTFLRGIGWVAIPTTVLGMVDAAIGGKTGIDLPEAKNQVGVFHEPKAVLADPELLDGLPAGEVRSGLGEIVKTGFCCDPTILDLIASAPQACLDVTSGTLAELIERAIRAKAAVVSLDLRERTSGERVGRERLNYGHTLGHAIETREQFRIRHGEAVAIGMVFAAELAHQVLGLSSIVVAQHRALLGALGLPTSYAGASFAELLTLMRRDKKTRGDTLRFVGLTDVGAVRIISDPAPAALESAYRLISE